MIITNGIKERFVKDNRLSIRLYEEPYFTDRLSLYDPFFNTIEKWNNFLKILENYDTAEDYYAIYNKTLNDVIDYIRNNEHYIEFNTDKHDFSINPAFRNISSKDIFHHINVGKRFVSIDMCKANFNSLKHYNPAIFNNKDTWEDFLSMFTDIPSIISSKNIREEIFGKCNCSRQVSYEKTLTCKLLENITTEIPIEKCVFFSNDELVFDITDCDNSILDIIQSKINEFPLPFRMEPFTLLGVQKNNINRCIGYIRKLNNGTLDFKCFSNIQLPFVLRKILNQPITESDKAFIFEDEIATIISTPEIKIISDRSEVI